MAASTQSTVLSGARVVLPTGTVAGGRVIVDGERIAGSASPGTPVADLSGHWIVPGFVDMHNHGGGGASFTSGTAEEVLKGVRTHRAHGTTTLIASTVTGELDELARRAGLLAELTQQGEIAGIHFEGPFINACRKGAHKADLLRDPDPAEVRKLVDAAHGAARMVTLATELPGGLDSVRLLAEHGVIAAIGHTDATYDQTRRAIDAGATVATHLYNAMPGLEHRAPGPIAALLEDERVTVELINDGTHLHPAMLELAFHHAGAHRVALITDAMDAAGFGDGTYHLGPLEVEVKDGVARLVEGGSIMRLHADPGHRLQARGDRRRAARRVGGPGDLRQPRQADRPVRPDRLAGTRQVRRPRRTGRRLRPQGRHAARRMDRQPRGLRSRSAGR